MRYVYKAIGELADELWNDSETMTISELARYLRQNGFYHEANRGLFRAISCAYDAFVEEGDQDTADCIANAYTTDNGEYAWGN